MALRDTIARNTAFNMAGRIWEALLSLVLIPYIIARIGEPYFGLWALIGSFVGYVGLVDLGFGSGFVKYIAEHHARRDTPAISAVVSTGLLFYLALGLVVLAVSWPLAEPALRQVQHSGLLSAEFLPAALLLIKWRLVLFVAASTLGVFTAVQSGLQRMGITNALSFAASLVKAVATIAFLESGVGVMGLMYAEFAAFALIAAASVPIAFRLVPGLRISVAAWRRDVFRNLFSFGGYAQVARLANLIMMETDKVIAGFWGGALNWTARYEIAQNPANKVRQIPAMVLSALIPVVSDLDARGDDARLRRLYLRSTKYLASIAVPVTLLAAALGGSLIRTLMGGGYEQSAGVFRIIVIGYLLNVLPGGGINIALGKGRADLQMKTGVISMTSNIVFTILLVLTIGFYGIPLGTAFSMLVSWVWFLGAMRRLIGVRAGELLRVSVLWPVLASVPGTIACAALDLTFADVVGRLPNAAVAAAGAAIFAITYLVILRQTPFLDAADAEFLLDTLRLRRIPGARWFARAARKA